MQHATDNLVSIVTPAYRASRFIGSTIESVLAQEHTRWEMIIADDCSPDDTVDVVNRYAAADSRVRLVKLNQNHGAAGARNAALEETRGRYVAFLDSDDLWLPAKLRVQLAFMAETNAALSFTSFRRITQSGDRTGRLIPVPERLDYKSLLKNTAIVTSTVMLDTSVTGPVRMTRVYYDDFVLWLSILKRGVVAHGLPSDLARYRVVKQSISRNKANSARQVWRTYRDVERLGFGSAAWCFANYACRAALKYRSF